MPQVKADAERLVKTAANLFKQLLGVELSKPGTGRFYKRRKGPGFKNVKNVVAGPLQKGEKRTRFLTKRRDLTKFHRASAPGNPPARDFGTLFRSRFVEKSGPAEYSVGVNTAYARTLEEKMNRPFMRTVRDLFLRQVQGIRVSR